MHKLIFYFIFSLLVALSLFSNTANAFDFQQEKSLYANALRLKNNQQYLLSSIYFGLLSQTSLDLQMKFLATRNYIIMMDRLNEHTESHVYLIRALSDRENPIKQDFILLAKIKNIDVKEELNSRYESDYGVWTRRYNVTNGDQPKGDWKDLYELQQLLVTEKRRNAALGMSLSAVLPGTGQLYLGDFRAAALSFLVNGLFGFATYQFFDRDLPGPGAASALVFSITYTGNILNVYKILDRRKNNLKRRIDEFVVDRIIFTN
ncbi:MAG: hypothetical protein KDD48_04715 [Bdellovibrionales bacterium]|nr:hypothetical protein [Bdellovibrionales bacterium]